MSAAEPITVRVVDIAERTAGIGWRTAGPPLLVAGGFLGAAVLLHFRDPHSAGSYGLCPFYELTGWWCPGCGGLRAMHNLTQGHLLDAVHSNVFLLPLLVVLALWWGKWALGRWRGRPGAAFPFTLRGNAQWVLIGGLVLFTVVRNMPFGTWLTPV